MSTKGRGPVAAILLAADLGADGVLRCVSDSDAVEAAVSVLARVQVDQLVVVLGEPAGTLAFPLAAPVTTVRRDADWEVGLARGIASGVQSLQPDAAAILLATTDLYDADVRPIRRAIRRWRRGESECFACEREGRPVLPVLVDRRHRGELLALGDRDDAAAVIAHHPDGCTMVSRDATTPSPAE